eukprot:67496-Pleurochrysis_carterae.AAC.1
MFPFNAVWKSRARAAAAHDIFSQIVNVEKRGLDLTWGYHASLYYLDSTLLSALIPVTSETGRYAIRLRSPTLRPDHARTRRSVTSCLAPTVHALNGHAYPVASELTRPRRLNGIILRWRLSRLRPGTTSVVHNACERTRLGATANGHYDIKNLITKQPLKVVRVRVDS